MYLPLKRIAFPSLCTSFAMIIIMISTLFQTLNKSGVVTAVAPTGTPTVQFDGLVWCLSPAAVTKDSADEDESKETESDRDGNAMRGEGMKE